MNKTISLVFLAGGLILMTYGISASDSLSSALSRFFSGSPTDRTMWLLLGGIVAAVIGGTGLLRGSKTS